MRSMSFWGFFFLLRPMNSSFVHCNPCRRTREDAQILVEGADRVQSAEPADGGVHGVLGAVQLAQSEGIEPCVPGRGEAAH